MDEPQPQEQPQGKPLPSLQVMWDEQNKGVILGVSPDFGNWDWVKAVLGMAMEQADMIRRMQHAQAAAAQAQAQAAAQAQHADIQAKLNGRGALRG